MTTLLNTPITVAGGPFFTTPIALPLGQYQAPPQRLLLQGKFTWSNGGTSVSAYLQTTLDNGALWFDIASWVFGTASLTEIYDMSEDAIGTPVVPTTGSLAANTCLCGIFGPLLRVQWSSVGTYAGTTLQIDAPSG